MSTAVEAMPDKAVPAPAVPAAANPSAVSVPGPVEVTWPREDRQAAELDEALKIYKAVLTGRRQPVKVPTGPDLAAFQGCVFKWASRQGVDEGELLARLSRQSGLMVMPLNSVHPTGAAEQLLLRWRRRFPVQRDTPLPWLPVDRLGPFLVVAHYTPTAVGVAGLPAALVLKVLVPRSDYDRIYAEALRMLYATPARLGAAGMSRTPFPLPGAEAEGPGAAAEPVGELSATDRTLLAILRSGGHEESEVMAGLPQNEALARLRTDGVLMRQLELHLAGRRLLPLTSLAPTMAMHELLPRDFAILTPALCIYSAGNTRFVVLPDASQEKALEDQLNQSGNLPIRLCAAQGEESEIRRLVDSISGNLFLNLAGTSDQWSSNEDTKRTMQIDPVPFSRVSVDQVSRYLSDTPKLVEYIIYRAMLERASDIHIEPVDEGTRVRYRVNGLLLNLGIFPSEQLAQMVAVLKIAADKDVAEKRVGQDGSFPVAVGRARIEIRLSTLPTRGQESVVLRLIQRGNEVVTLQKMRIPDRTYQLMIEAADSPDGLFLVTGPTGSGKSTTLSALLTYLNGSEYNLMSVEDPVEARINGIKQIQTNEKIGLTFANVLRGVLRHDPDIVMVGEIRDRETADIALRASNTGHLVVATLHTNGAVETPARMLEMGLDPAQLAMSLVLTQGQRLARELCSCATRVGIDALVEKEFLKAGLPVPDYTMRKVGCPMCKMSGHRGRRVIMEVCPITPEFSEQIAARAKYGDLLSCAKAYGFRSIYQEALALVATGVISFEEARDSRRPFRDLQRVAEFDRRRPRVE